MKVKLIFLLMLIPLTACSDKPSVERLIENETAIALIKDGVRSSNDGGGIIPISMDVGDLIASKRIPENGGELIKLASHCQNLSAIELTVLNGEVSHIEINSELCDQEES